MNSIHSKAALCAIVSAVPEHHAIHMRLGLDGDCDFTRRVTDYVPFSCGKEELLALIEKQVDAPLQTMRDEPKYLVFGRRFAVYLPDIYS